MKGHFQKSIMGHFKT